MTSREKTVLLIGAFDTKGEEYAFVKGLIEARGHRVLAMDTSVIGAPQRISADIPAAWVAEAGGMTLEALRAGGDRGTAMATMAAGAAVLVRELFVTGRFDGALGMGGSGGTAVIATALRTLPVGVPKILVSTVASGDTRPFLGTRDIMLLPSVVDVAGLNRISRPIFAEAAGAICGMLELQVEIPSDERPVVAVSMFGNTTQCVDRCRELLTAHGYEVLVFHCTGTGGRTMEDLVDDHLVAAVLDITTTEWADELCGGVFSAGPTRLDAPGRAGIPHLIVPGCLDMVNFGPRATTPERYAGRLFSVWNPSVTLMRTTPVENAELGRIFAQKANQAGGPVGFLLPRGGLSILDSRGHEFWWPEADQALFDAVTVGVRPGIAVETMEENINDPAFADRAVELLLTMCEERP